MRSAWIRNNWVDDSIVTQPKRPKGENLHKKDPNVWSKGQQTYDDK